MERRGDGGGIKADRGVEDAWPMHIGSAGLHVEFTQKEMARSEDKIICTSHIYCMWCISSQPPYNTSLEMVCTYVHAIKATHLEHRKSH